MKRLYVASSATVRERLSDALHRHINPGTPDTTSVSVGIDVCGVLARAVARARQKALAIQAELDLLAINAEVVTMQLEPARDFANTSGYDIGELKVKFESRITEVHAAVASKRSALETDAVTIDEALEAALSAAAVLSDVRAGGVPGFAPFACTHTPRSSRPWPESVMCRGLNRTEACSLATQPSQSLPLVSQQLS